MRELLAKATIFLIVILLLVATCPYAISSIIAAHGEHTLQTVLQGDDLKVTLRHISDVSDDDHGHSHHSHHSHTGKTNHSAHHESDNSSDEHEDHVVIISASHIANPSQVAIKTQKTLIAILPIVASYITASVSVSRHDVFNLEKSQKPPSYLVYHRTIVLHV